MNYEQLLLDIKEKIDPWDFDNFDWLKGKLQGSDNLRVFFTEAIPRLEKMIAENPQIERYRKLKVDCEKRLKGLINENNKQRRNKQRSKDGTGK